MGQAWLSAWITEWVEVSSLRRGVPEEQVWEVKATFERMRHCPSDYQEKLVEK